MLKKAFVNGEEIPQEAVQHEFDRLARLYLENGMSADELKQNVEKLLGQLSAMMITAECAQNVLRLRIQVGCRKSVSVSPSFALPGGTVECEAQDEDLIIKAVLGQGGANA